MRRTQAAVCARRTGDRGAGPERGRAGQEHHHRRDTVFVLGTGLLDLDTLKQQAAWGFTPANINVLGAAAADTLARAIVRAMLHAQTVGSTPSYRDKFPGAFAR